MSMKPFFESDRNFLNLQKECLRWEGTPHRKQACKPGVGCDCVNFVHGACYNIGALPKIKFPDYVVRGGGEQTLLLMRETILQIRGIQVVWTEGMNSNPLEVAYRGDLVLISSGKALHHLIICDELPKVWHCFNQVQRGSITDPIVVDRIKNIFRIYG